MAKDVLYVLDLDRTLIDTDKIVKLLALSLDRQGFDGDGMIDDIERARLSESDIDAKKAIDSLGEGAWKGVKEYFLEDKKTNSLVFDDAKAFLEGLRMANLPHIILTFGVSKAWQELKLISTGLNEVPAIVSDSREKSRTVRSWKGNNGIYTPPGFPHLSADSIVLIDDRLGAFSDISIDFKGYLLDRTGKLGSDVGLPKNVQIIKSLSEIKI